MIACPKGVKEVAVSWTVNPVTHIPEVEVNRASTKDNCFEWVLKGKVNRTVPKRIALIKLMANTWAGWNLLSPLIFCSFELNLLLLQSFVNRLSGSKH